MKTSLLYALLILLCFNAPAQVGSPDPSFGKNGIQLTGSNKNSLAESAIKVLPLPGGGFFLVINGDATPFTNASNAFLVRYKAQGITDAAFGMDGFSVPVTFIATDATLQADGKIVVVGYGKPFSSYGTNAIVVVRYKTDGKLDTTFSGDGIQVTHTLNANSTDMATGVGMQGDKIVLSLHSLDGQFRAARYLPDGSLDNNFGTGGIATTNFPELTYEAFTTGLLLQNDKIVVAGSLRDRLVLTRFNNDGTVDNTFNTATPGLIISDPGFTTGDGAITGDAGKIVVAGSSADEFIIARFNYDGSPDISFSNDGKAATAFTNAIVYDVIMYGNRVVVGGSAGAGFAIARFNDDGSMDISFSGDGKLITNFPQADSTTAQAIALQGNQLIAAGRFYAYDIIAQKMQQDLAVAQYNADGSNDHNFSGDGMVTGYFPVSFGEFRNAVVQGDSKIIVVGDLGMSSGYVVRYNKDGSLDSTFDGNGMQVVDMTWAASVRMQNDKIVVAGFSRTFSDAGDVNTLVVARLNTDGSLDNSFDADGRVTLDLGPLGFTDLFPHALAIQGDKIIVVATTAFNINTEALLIARFNSEGSLDTGFSQDGMVTLEVGGYSGGTAVALQGDKIVVAGYAGTGDFLVARYNNDGTIDPAFGYLSTDIGQSTIDHPDVIRIENDKIIVAGMSSQPGELNYRVAIAHYNNDGSLDTGYDQDGKSLSAPIPHDLDAKSFSFDSSGKLYVATNQVYSPGLPYPGSDTIYRFNQDGTMDANFRIAAPFAIGNTIVNNDRLYASGTLYLPEFSNISFAFSKAVIAAYLLDGSTSISFTCPPNKSVYTDAKKCNAIVTGIDPVFAPAGSNAPINYSLTGATTARGTGTASGSTFNKGLTTVTYTLANDASVTCSFTVTVQDNEPPVITNVIANPNMLWPPNHQMRDVEIKYELSDNCGANAVLSVTSNEPPTGTDEQDVAIDWQIINGHYIKLRAERKGNGNGRIYTITIMATDAAGNKSSKQVQVKVPQNGPVERDISIKAYPNPTTYEFNLSSQDKILEKATIKVTNNFGRLMETISNVSLAGVVKFGANYPPGIYTVEIFNNLFSGKLILVKLAPR